MEDKKLIANLLLEIAKNSATELIENADIDSEIKEAAKNMGLILPSPDFAVFKTKWADINKSNLNGIRLPRKAVEDGIQTLVGKNLNFEHKGAYNICGFCLSVKIKKDEIECIQVFYKSVYPDEFEELKEKIKTKEAAVSFEIWNRSPEDGKSVVKELEDGTKEITKIICHGTGLLLVNPPACPTAKIFHLIAKKELENAETITDKVFEQDLCFASLAIEEPKCKNCGTCTCGKDKEEKVMVKCEKCGKEFESAAEEKICVECSSLPKEESKTQTSEETKTEGKPVETKIEEKSEIAETKTEEPKVEETKEEKSEAKSEEAPKVEAEAKVEEPKVEEKTEEKKEEVAEEKKEEAQPLETIEPKIVVKVTSIFSEVSIDTYVDGTPSGLHDVKGYSKKITEYKDGTKDEVEEEVEIKKKYDLAELEEKVNAAKAEKDTEISSLKTECENLDKEIKKLKEELDTKNQEIAELKAPKVVKKEKEMTVGSVEANNDSEINRRVKEINTIISRKGK
jgi:ribosomal protein L37E